MIMKRSFPMSFWYISGWGPPPVSILYPMIRLFTKDTSVTTFKINRYNIFVYFFDRVYMKLRDRYQVQNNQNNQCARGAILLDNFFQSGRQPTKVYIFGKLSSRAFQKHVLLWVCDHSEKSCGTLKLVILVILLVILVFFARLGKLDQKNKRIYIHLFFWSTLYENLLWF